METHGTEKDTSLHNTSQCELSANHTFFVTCKQQKICTLLDGPGRMHIKGGLLEK